MIGMLIKVNISFFLFFLSFLLCLFKTVKAQEVSTKDSIQIFYNQLFLEMEKDYIFSNKIDWKKEKMALMPNALKAKTFRSSLRFASDLFDAVKANHTALYFADTSYGSRLNKPFTSDDFSESFLKKFQRNDRVQVKVIDDNYGYVFIPGMLLLNADKDSLSHVAQNIYNRIIEVEKQKSIKGWMVDLRTNIGGNVYPMLLGLYHFLGEGIVAQVLNPSGESEGVLEIKNSKFYSEGEEVAAILINAKANPSKPVVFITGKLTASAGEDVIVGFRGRGNTWVVGEESYGLLSGNDEVKLPYDVIMALTMSNFADRNGVYTPSIKVDVVVSKKDNFEDLSKDQNILEAIQWINLKQIRSE